MIAISEIIATLVNFLDLDQFLGFSSSFSENSISCSNHQSKGNRILTSYTSEEENLSEKKWPTLPLAAHCCIHSVVEQNAHLYNLHHLPSVQQGPKTRIENKGISGRQRCELDTKDLKLK